MLGLGDFISGLIHNVNRFDSRLLITEQVVKISELIAEFINELSKHFYVKYAIINGNHSRIVAEKIIVEKKKILQNLLDHLLNQD